MRTPLLVSLLALPLLACTGEEGTSGTCSPDVSLEAGGVVGTIDGAAWSTTATWLWQGESLQINADPADGWRFSLVGQLADSGETVKAAVDAGSFPVTVPLGEAGAWALVYPTDGDSYHTANAAGGTLTITDVADDLTGCFAFDAATDGGEAVSITDGSLRAVPF